MLSRQAFLKTVGGLFVLSVFGRQPVSEPKYVLLLPRKTLNEYVGITGLFGKTRPDLPHLYFRVVGLPNQLKEVKLWINAGDIDKPQKIKQQVEALSADLKNEQNPSKLRVALQKLMRGEKDESGLFIYV